MALAAMFLCRIIFILCTKINPEKHQDSSANNLSAAGYRYRKRNFSIIASVSGALTFAFCGSAWFSAVEAEVYAMSTFLTSLCIWISLVCVDEREKGRKRRYILLLMYLTGLSLGVHELGLLCIPVYTMVFLCFGKKKKIGLTTLFLSLICSLGVIMCVLNAMTKGLWNWGAIFELFFVNDLGKSYGTGLLIYGVIILIVFITLLVSLAKNYRFISILFAILLIWLSGIFNFTENVFIALLISAVFTIILSLRKKYVSIFRYTSWGIVFMIIGISSFMIFMIRAQASPFLNTGDPSDIFSLSSYISRDQYGTKPLLYGATPYSKPMFEEHFTEPDRYPRYTRYLLATEKPVYKKKKEGARLLYTTGKVSENDSIENLQRLENNRDAYLLADYKYHIVRTPELNMWFPRITSPESYHISAYKDWAGMDIDNMEEVEISETVDSTGRNVPLMEPSGERVPKIGKRPTYLHNLRYLLSYQISFMYLRYLGWNFIGRQNDIPSSGEIEHGNVISGFPFIDNAIYGNQDLLPYSEGKGNKGRNIYYGLPFIAGLLGIIFLCVGGRNTGRVMGVVTLFFIMTGIAIVFYLNQDPIEPRERDYAFIGSFMAFGIWIGIGCGALFYWVSKNIKNRFARGLMATILSLGLPSIMIAQNYDDNDRKGRQEPSRFSEMILDNRHPSIIFTYGDNATFPLWYAQEVLEKGKGHTLVEISYLSSPWYVVNLMKQGEKSIKLTAKEEDILYGAYAYTSIPPDTSAYIPTLQELISTLYASKERKPSFSHARFKIGVNGGEDTVTIKLRDLSNGSGSLPFRQLMLLDIIATNNLQDEPRNLFFHQSVGNALGTGMDSFKHPALFGKVLSLKDYDSIIEKRENEIVHNTLPENSDGLQGYVDALTRDQIRIQRGALINMANSVLDSGNVGLSSEIINFIEKNYPYEIVPAGALTIDGTYTYEGIEYIRLLKRVYDLTGEKEYQTLALTRIGMISKELNQWIAYYNSLEDWQRATLSASTVNKLAKQKEIKELYNSLNPS